MDLRDIATLFGIIMAVIAGLWLFTVFTEKPQGAQEQQAGFALAYFSTAGNDAYSIFRHTGPGSITMISYDEKPRSKILILRERGIGMDSFDAFADRVENLRERGMEVETITPFSRQRDGILIIPSGAMPYYIISELESNTSSLAVYYIGRKDFVIRNGIKNESWYASMSEHAKSKLYVLDTTLDEFMPLVDDSFLLSLAEYTWAAKNRKEFYYSSTKQSLETASISSENASYVRLIYRFGNVTGFNDSQMLEKSPAIEVDRDIFPGQYVTLTFSLNDTNGSAHLVAEKNGAVAHDEKLQRNTEESIYLRRLALSEPGNYVVYVKDNSGTLASAIVRVKDLEVRFAQARGRTYVFNVTLGGEPLDGEKIFASLNNSTNKQGYISSGGILSVPAKIPKGKNVFNFEYQGARRSVEIENNFEGIFDVYVRYGVPGFALVLAVYFIARLNRRPHYVIRIGEGAREVRKDMKISPAEVVAMFARARQELGLVGPITANELSTVLKRSFTDGSDVAEGNVEEILKKLEDRGEIQSHAGYYQLAREGEVRGNVLRRLVKEKLIQHGFAFEEKRDRFITKDLEICLEGELPKKRGLVIFEDENSIKAYYLTLSEHERASLRIKEHNGIARLVSVEHMDELL